MNFAGKALPLNDGDVIIIAGYLGCHIAAVRAVLQIEAAGKGFDSKGRPKMLFEPHVFYRELGPGAKRDRAVREGLAYAKWKSGSYPADSYPRLMKAIAIDRDAALRSASWNLGQVMGFNHKAAGFADVVSFVEAMKHSEGAGLYAMARFIVSNKLQGHLRNLNWTAFARGYNGSGYAKHGYHTKLANAYAKRPASERVTPSPATDAQLSALIGKASPPAPLKPSPRPIPPPAPEREPEPFKVTKDMIETVQTQLVALGYTEVGGIDAKIGTMTRAAILSFREDNGLPLIPEIDEDMVVALSTAKPRKLAPERTGATPGEVREKVPEVRSNWLAKIGAFIIGIPAMLGAAFDGILGNLGAATGYITPVKDFVGDVPGWVWFVGIAGVALGLFLVARHGEKKGVEAFKDGSRR